MPYWTTIPVDSYTVIVTRAWSTEFQYPTINTDDCFYLPKIINRAHSYLKFMQTMQHAVVPGIDQVIAVIALRQVIPLINSDAV